jgi:hypothetical protein
MDARVEDRSLGNSDDPIISHLLLPRTSLIRRIEPTKREAIRHPEGRFVAENDNIEVIPVLAGRLREESGSYGNTIPSA